MLTDGLECCDVLSDSHSDGTHSLQTGPYAGFDKYRGPNMEIGGLGARSPRKCIFLTYMCAF